MLRCLLSAHLGCRGTQRGRQPDISCFGLFLFSAPVFFFAPCRFSANPGNCGLIPTLFKCPLDFTSTFLALSRVLSTLFLFRFSSFFASWSVLGPAGLGTAIAFAPVAEPPVTLEPPVLAPGANPLQPTC